MNDQHQRDRTESKVRQWATRVNGEALTNRDIVELVLAVDDDGNDRHEETIRLLEEQNARLLLLEEWRASCPAGSLAEFVEAEHDARHSRHMVECHPPRRADDPEGEDHTADRRGSAALIPEDEEMSDMRRAWRVVRWGVAAFVLPIIATAGYKLAALIFGGS